MSRRCVNCFLVLQHQMLPRTSVFVFPLICFIWKRSPLIRPEYYSNKKQVLFSSKRGGGSEVDLGSFRPSFQSTPYAEFPSFAKPSPCIDPRTFLLLRVAPIIFLDRFGFLFTVPTVIFLRRSKIFLEFYLASFRRPLVFSFPALLFCVASLPGLCLPAY
jgi:hypothetical protein